MNSFIKLFAIPALVFVGTVSAQASCPDVTGTWVCLRDTPHDGSESQTIVQTQTVNGNGDTVFSYDNQTANETMELVADGQWHSLTNTAIYYRSVCGENGIPIQYQFSNSLTNPTAPGNLIGAQEDYPTPLVNPTHIFSRATCPACGNTYPQWFGYICRKQ